MAPLPDAIRILVEHGRDTGRARSPVDVPIRSPVEVLLVRAVTDSAEPVDGRAGLLLTLLSGALRPELLAAAEGTRPSAR